MRSNLVRVLFVVLSLLSVNVQAKLSGIADKDAKALYLKLAGVPLRSDNPNYSKIVQAVQDGDLRGAAAIITNPTSGSTEFYEIVVRDIASMYNRYESSLTDRLNDFIALYQGIVRDSDGVNTKVDDLMTANYLYFDPTLNGTGNAYAVGSNTHFDFIARRPGGYIRSLVRTMNADFVHVGAYHTRAMGMDYYQGGTIRRPFESLLQRFFVVSQKSVMMPNLPSTYVRQDVPLQVSGVPIEMIQTPKCMGCHPAMDAAARSFLGYRWNANTQKVEVVAPGATGFDQVNEVNRPEQLARSTAGKVLVTKDMNDKVFGYQNLDDRGAYLEGDIQNMTQFMGFVTQSRAYVRGFARRIAFTMFTGRLMTLDNMSDEDNAVLVVLEPIIESLADSLSSHRNLRKTFEEAAIAAVVN